MTKSIISETSNKNSKYNPRNIKTLPTQTELQRLFTYDGFNLIRRVRTSNTTNIGDTAGTLHKTSGYRIISVNKVLYYAHRLIWQYVYSAIDTNKILDHVNADKADNRICNLREITFNENLFNTTAKGFHFCKTSKMWVAKIQVNKKTTTIGYFKTAAEARAAYLAAKKIYHVITDPQANIDERNRLQKYYEMTN